MRHGLFVSQVMERAGLADEGEARRVAEVVLGVLGELLCWSDARALADELPTPFGDSVARAQHGQAFELKDLYRRVADREGVPVGHAAEHADVVSQVVAELLSEGTLHRLKEGLPEHVATLLRPRLPPVREPPVRLHPERRSLAEGRPGGEHPLYGARPPMRVHTNSVAAENPHGDSKLSSAMGLTQEREGESLASGKPR